jgi:hypothetical protein
LLPAEREVAGLLGLMLLIHARRAARSGPDGEIVLLEKPAALGSNANGALPGRVWRRVQGSGRGTMRLRVSYASRSAATS